MLKERAAGGDGRKGDGEGVAEGGAFVRVDGSEAKNVRRRTTRERLCSPQDQRRSGLNRG